MLSQSSIQLSEGSYSARGVLPFWETHHVDMKKGASCSWKPFSLQRRRRGPRFHHCSISVVVCSQGIQSAPVEPVSEFGSVRASEGGANHGLRLDGDDVRICAVATDDARGGHEEFDCEEPVANGSTSSGRRLSLRSPAQLPEVSGPDSEALDDTSDLLDRSPNVEPPDVVAEPDAPNNSFDRFVMARAAGRELEKRTKEGQVLGFVTEEYYSPRIGDYVMGVVVSGSFGRLDIDIGAQELGYLFRKDVMPLDLCDVREMAWESQNSPVFVPPHGIRVVHDEEVLNLAPEAPLAVELGTVLAMEVKEMTPSGRALLSARSVAREYAWQRVCQLHEYNATLEVQITEWTTTGLVARVEGLRAFLPTHYLVNHVPEPSSVVSVSCKEYVGQKFTVMISSVDEKRSNVVISEKKAWMARNAYVGALIEGVVTEIQPYGVHLRVKDTDISGVLHISNISRARVDNIANVFSIGEDVKAMVVPAHSKERLSFSTADLETDRGLILIDKEAVFQGAEGIASEIAKAYKSKESKSVVDNDRVEKVDQERVIANWDWLEFFDKTELD